MRVVETQPPYELFKPVTIMFFYLNKRVMCDKSTGCWETNKRWLILQRRSTKEQKGRRRWSSKAVLVGYNFWSLFQLVNQNHQHWTDLIFPISHGLWTKPPKAFSTWYVLPTVSLELMTSSLKKLKKVRNREKTEDGSRSSLYNLIVSRASSSFNIFGEMWARPIPWSILVSNVGGSESAWVEIP